jgi:hypothetical protein
VAWYGLDQTEFEEWGQQFGEAKDAKRKATWEYIQEAQSYAALSSTPTKTLDWYAADPNRQNPFPDLPTPLAPAEQERLTNMRSDLVKTIEQAYMENPETDSVSMAIFMKYPVEDLKLLRADELGIDLDWLAGRQFTTAAHIESEAEIERLMTERWEANRRGQLYANQAEYTAKRYMDFFNPFGDNPAGQSGGEFLDEWYSGEGQKILRDRETFREEVTNEVYGRIDKNHEAEIAKWRTTHAAQLEEDRKVRQLSSQLGIDTSDWVALPDVDTLREMAQQQGVLKGVAPEETIAEFDRLIGATTELEATDDVNARLNRDEAYVRGMINSGADPAHVLEQRSIPSNLMGGFLGAFGWGVDKGVQLAGNVFLWAPDKLAQLSGPLSDWASPMEYLRQRHETGKQDAIDEYTNQVIAQPDEEVLFRAIGQSAEMSWAEEVRENSEAYQQYLEMAGGDITLAAGLYVGDILDQPAVLQASEQIVAETRAQDELFTEQIREQDFRFSSEMMDVLSVWGRNVPGRLATAATLLVTDKDYEDMLTKGEFSKAYHEIFEHAAQLNFTPSAAVGIDGSMAGLVMDLGLGISFDPLTFFLAPKFLGAAKGKVLGTEAAAKFTAKSAPVKVMVDDAINFALSPTRDAGQLFKVISWMSSTGRAEFLHVTGMVDQILFNRKWQTGAKGPQGAMEVSTEFMASLIPKEVRAAANADEIAKLADNILNKAHGFDEATEITLSRSGQTLHLTDGVKRVLAAETIPGLNRVPARLHIVDDVVGDPLKLVTNKLLNKKGEASVDDLLDMSQLDPIDLSDLATLRGDIIDITENIDDILKTAVDEGEPILVEFSTKNGKISLVDGHHRVAAAKLAGKKRVPVVLKRVDDVSVDPRFKLAGGTLKSLDDFLGKPLDTIAGRNIDDLLQGKQLKKTLKSVETQNGQVTTRPDRIFPGETLLGRVDKQKLMEIVERDILNGAKPSDGARVSMYTSIPGRFREMTKHAIPNEIRSFFTQANTVRRIDLHGTEVIADTLKQVTKMYGDDLEGASRWTRRLLQYEQDGINRVKAHEAALALLAPQRARLAQLKQAAGGTLKDTLATKAAKAGDVGYPTGRFDVSGTSFGRKVAANRRKIEKAMAGRDAASKTAAQKAYKKAQKKYDEAVVKATKDLGTLPNNIELQNLIEELWNDFNKTKIVPRWKKEIKKFGEEIFDEDLGIVRWEYLEKMSGRTRRKAGQRKNEKGGAFAETMLRQAKVEDVGAINALMKQLNTLGDTPMSFETKLSPIEMIAASTLTGSKWIKFNQHLAVEMVRTGALAIQKAWIIDKVLRPATAMTVSGDELLRIFHKGGRYAVDRYIKDRALFVNARVQAAYKAGHGNSALGALAGRHAVRDGAQWSNRVQKRISELDRYTIKAQEWERIFYDDHGLGWTEIFPDSPEYLQAAQQWSAGFMQESGFRAYLRGPDAFTEWFNSVDGAKVRNATVLSRKGKRGAKTGTLSSVEDAYQGWDTIFDKIIMQNAREAGNYDDVLRLWKETAAKVDASQGCAEALFSKVRRPTPLVRRFLRSVLSRSGQLSSGLCGRHGRRSRRSTHSCPLPEPWHGSHGRRSCS